MTRKCLGQNLLYVPLAVFLAIETGMRLQEIFNLTWADINTDTRRIEIQKSKTDNVKKNPGREIVMTVHAMFMFLSIMPHRLNPDQKVFPMSKGAFKRAWKGVVKRSGIQGLTFHDLRHEAGSRFDAAGLTKGEHDQMMGHANSDMASLYIHADLNRIQEKLDRHEHENIWAAQEARGNDPRQIPYSITEDAHALAT